MEAASLLLLENEFNPPSKLRSFASTSPHDKGHQTSRPEAAKAPAGAGLLTSLRSTAEPGGLTLHLTGIPVPRLETRTGSGYLASPLAGPWSSPAPLQCQRHSGHLISSPRRADSKEKLCWHKCTEPLPCSEGRRLQTTFCWSCHRRRQL